MIFRRVVWPIEDLYSAILIAYLAYNQGMKKITRKVNVEESTGSGTHRTNQDTVQI
jgi:hypothetical protein